MTKPKRYGTRYPWVLWFGKDSFVLKQGRDYACSTSSMSLMTRTNARKHGVLVTIEVPRDGEVRVTVTGRMG